MSSSESSPSRRRFLAGAAVAGASVALGCVDRATSLLTPESSALLDRGGNDDHHARTFDHVIVVMMENRSFDHLVGWARHADGRQEGLKFTDKNGVRHHTHSLAPDFQGCGFADPDHSYDGGRVQFDGGKCDGFLRSGDNDEYAIGYYRQRDLGFLGRAVEDWTIGDRYFCSILGPTFPNRFYQHSARTDRISNTLVVSQLPTIWDRIAAAGLTGRYYYSDLPFIALWGNKYRPIARTFDTFIADAAAGTLPNLAFIDPSFAGEDAGTSNDDHPHADIRSGEHFMHRIYTAVTNSPAWERTVLVFNFDEWGGFFDHVPPPTLATAPEDVTAGNQDGRLGFRTPLLVVSPFAREGYVAHDVYDHTSILKMVETRWKLAPLSARDAATNNLVNVLDLDGSPRTAPQYPAPPDILAAPCPAPASGNLVASVASTTLAGARGMTRTAAWNGLRDVARAHGWGM